MKSQYFNNLVSASKGLFLFFTLLFQGCMILEIPKKPKKQKADVYWKPVSQPFLKPYSDPQANHHYFHSGNWESAVWQPCLSGLKFGGNASSLKFRRPPAPNGQIFLYLAENSRELFATGKFYRYRDNAWEFVVQTGVDDKFVKDVDITRDGTPLAGYFAGSEKKDIVIKMYKDHAWQMVADTLDMWSNTVTTFYLNIDAIGIPNILTQDGDKTGCCYSVDHFTSFSPYGGSWDNYFKFSTDYGDPMGNARPYIMNDGKRYLFTYYQRDIRFYDFENGELDWSYFGNAAWVKSMAVATDGTPYTLVQQLDRYPDSWELVVTRFQNKRWRQVGPVLRQGDFWRRKLILTPDDTPVVGFVSESEELYKTGVYALHNEEWVLLGGKFLTEGQCSDMDIISNNDGEIYFTFLNLEKLHVHKFGRSL